MAKKNPNEVIFYFREIPDLQKKWRVFLGWGVLLVVLGIFAMIFSGWATIFTIEFLGFLLVFGGIFQMVNSWQARRWTGFSLSFLLGILSFVIGALCILKPVASASAITLLLAAFFFVGGLFRMIFSLQHRFEHWGWMFFNGLIAFLLGILIVAEWPISALWLIGFFVGIDMLFTGLNWIFLSLAAKKQLR